MNLTEGKHIRSYVLRQGRMTDGQVKAYETLYPIHGLEYKAEKIDFNSLFPGYSNFILEIGFGMGQATADIAEVLTDSAFLGVEVHQPGVGALLKLIDDKDLSNIKVIRHDAVDVLEHMIPDESLDGVHVFFPDPWRKKRHHKRRIVRPEIMDLLVPKIKTGGYFYTVTDWEDYAFHMLEVLENTKGLVNTSNEFSDPPSWRPITKYERRGINKSHKVWNLMYQKK